jgi:endonuclease-8
VPEGDSVRRTAARLHAALAGAAVTSFELRLPDLALVDLTGDRVQSVVPRGKHILIRFGSGSTLHSHLRMDGSWRLTHAGQPLPGREVEVRALIGTPDWLAAGFRLHDLAILSTQEESRLVGHLGPDLLDPDFDLDEALRRFAGEPMRPIGEALLNQRLTAGIGNVYKSEVLFLSRTNPWTTVSAAALPAILTDARRLLSGNLGRFDRSTTGWRQPGQQYWVYGRTGKPCRRCRTAIRSDYQGAADTERLTFFCPRCQPSLTGPMPLTE